MANSGLQIFNQDNVIQIDSDYSNLRLVGKYSATPNINDTSTWVFSRRADLQIPGTFPVVAFICSENTWVSTFTSNGIKYARVENNNGTPVTLFVFDQSPPVSQGYGFEVFNEQGVMVFSASEKYCRVLGQVSVTYDNPGGTYSYPGKTLAVIPNNNARTVSAGPSADVSKWDAVYWNSYCRNVSSSSMAIQYAPTRTLTALPGPPPNSGLTTNGNYLLVDVTGM